MTVKRFREIESLMVDLNATINQLVERGKITHTERDEWVQMESDAY
jgi:hypothetical protein